MAHPLFVAIAALSLVLLYHLLSNSKAKALARRHACALPPKFPHKDPLFGLDFMFAMHMDVPSMLFFHARHGNTFQVNDLGKSCIYTLQADNIRAVMSNGREWGVEPDRLPGMERFCGRGFLTTDGAMWMRSRRLLKPSFGRERAVNFEVLGRAEEGLLEEVEGEEGVVDLQPLLDGLSLQTSTLFLTGVSTLDDEAAGDAPCDVKAFLRAFKDALFGTGLRVMLGKAGVLLPKAQWLRSCGEAHDFLDFHIDKALKLNGERHLEIPSKVGGGNAKPQSLLEGLAEQTGDKMEIRSQVLQGMMAALETTSVLLSNTLLLLSRHPSSWEQLQREVVAMGHGLLTSESLQASKFIRNVLLESLRLYPVFPRLCRVALSDTKLPTGGGADGHSPIFMRKGASVGISFFALHREHSVFGANVDAFDPCRWDTIRPGPWEYMPFGGGQRSCLGKEKALIEASYVLVRLAQRFKHLESRDDRPWKGQIALTCKNVHGCKVALFD